MDEIGKAAGYVYVSPFESALALMEADGIELRAFGEFWPRYEAEGRAIACELMTARIQTAATR